MSRVEWEAPLGAFFLSPRHLTSILTHTLTGSSVLKTRFHVTSLLFSLRINIYSEKAI